MTFRFPLAGALAAAILLSTAAAASAGSLSFTAPQQLPHGDPNVKPMISGGEPSIAFDPNGDGHVYVTAPQGIPAVAGGVLGGNGVGIGYWASDDHGATFPRSGLTGSLLGGGDSDVVVLPNHNVLAADLEAAAAAICISTDFATTFPSCSNGVTSNQQGPENDRQWLTRGTAPNDVYLTYHDFAAGLPIIEKSTDGGRTFAPCVNVIDPGGPAAKTYTPQGGSLVSKPVVGADGTVYIEFATPDQTASPAGAPLGNLYEAVIPQGKCTTSPIPNYVIYQHAGADLARIFQASAIDGGGELYVLTAGIKQAGEQGSNLYLFTSTDGGKTWNLRPALPGQPANVFPAIAGGKGRGEAVMGWFGTATSNDPNNRQNQWRFYAAGTYDGGQTFTTTTVSPDPLHYGDICTSGIFCGTGVPGTGNNRNLADFASVAIDPATGCAAFAIPGDPYNRPDQPGGKNTFGSSAYVSRQNNAPACFTAANAGQPASAVSVTRKHAAKKRSHRKKARHHRRARRHAVRRHSKPRFTG